MARLNVELGFDVTVSTGPDWYGNFTGSTIRRGNGESIGGRLDAYNRFIREMEALGLGTVRPESVTGEKTLEMMLREKNMTEEQFKARVSEIVGETLNTLGKEYVYHMWLYP